MRWTDYHFFRRVDRWGLLILDVINLFIFGHGVVMGGGMGVKGVGDGGRVGGGWGRGSGETGMGEVGAGIISIIW